MDCRDIRRKLSDSSGGPVSPADRALIDEHLRNCGDCTEYVAEIEKTIRILRDLEEVEPPAGLTGKVMEKIRLGAQPRKDWIEKLFFPLHIKLPLEAFATVLIALAVAYVFRSIQPELQLAKAPPETPVIQQQLPVEKKSEMARSIQPEKPFQQDDILLKQKQSREPLADTGKPASSLSVEKKEKNEAAGIQPMPYRETVAGKAAEEPRAPAPLLKSAPSAGSAAGDGARQESRLASSELKTLTKEKAAAQFILVLAVRDLEGAAKEAEKAIAELGGNIEKAEKMKDSSSLFVKIIATRSDALMKKLSSLGGVKRQETVLAQQEATVTIKLVFERQ